MKQLAKLVIFCEIKTTSKNKKIQNTNTMTLNAENQHQTKRQQH
jgi:hypothetical protein